MKEFLEQKGFEIPDDRMAHAPVVLEKNLDGFIFGFEIMKRKVEGLLLNVRKRSFTPEEGYIYSPPNMILLEALEEYYELHREEIKGQVAALKEELRQTINRYEGKRLWLRVKIRMWLESKKLFLTELDSEYPEL